jgi:ribosomal protein S18 acetylase RimI-like enzyme
MQIIHCTEAQLDVLTDLFNDYRMFYEQPTEVAACRTFIQKNLQQKRSKIFLLLDDQGAAIGFSQLYPAICSLSMQPYHYLSDLFVIKSARRHGYAKYLMSYITEYFTKEGSQRLTLDTAITNKAAQSLYDSLGYKREDVYITYHQFLKIPS